MVPSDAEVLIRRTVLCEGVLLLVDVGLEMLEKSVFNKSYSVITVYITYMIKVQESQRQSGEGVPVLQVIGKNDGLHGGEGKVKIVSWGL